jgi:hypothetical protein
VDKHNVRGSKKIVLADGSARYISKLTIKQLRQIDALLDDLPPNSFRDKDIDHMRDILVIVFERIDQYLISDLDRLEDLFDIPTFNEVLDFILGGGKEKKSQEDGIKFKDIPFSEMEAMLLVEGVGNWKNLEEIEESLILDELLLIQEIMGKTKHNHYRMLASFQGIDMGEFEENTDDELPPEVLEKEREWKKKKEEHLKANGSTPPEVTELNSAAGSGGFGYQQI